MMSQPDLHWSRLRQTKTSQKVGHWASALPTPNSANLAVFCTGTCPPQKAFSIIHNPCITVLPLAIPSPAQKCHAFVPQQILCAPGCHGSEGGGFLASQTLAMPRLPETLSLRQASQSGFNPRTSNSFLAALHSFGRLGGPNKAAGEANGNELNWAICAGHSRGMPSAPGSPPPAG